MQADRTYRLGMEMDGRRAPPSLKEYARWITVLSAIGSTFLFAWWFPPRNREPLTQAAYGRCKTADIERCIRHAELWSVRKTREANRALCVDVLAQVNRLYWDIKCMPPRSGR